MEMGGGAAVRRQAWASHRAGARNDRSVFQGAGHRYGAEVEHQNQEHVEYVDLNEPLVTINVNTPEEYDALQSVVRMLRD